jgi:hypothetical protein
MAPWYLATRSNDLVHVRFGFTLLGRDQVLV